MSFRALLGLVVIALPRLATGVPQSQRAPEHVRQTNCPRRAWDVIRALLSADTLGVGVSSASEDSSRIDTLVTSLYAGAPDVAYVVTGFSLSCVYSRRDSVSVRVETQKAGRIMPDTAGSDHAIFVADSTKTVGYVDAVRHSGRWRVIGPYAPVWVSPAAALRRFDWLSADSRRALEALLRRPRNP